MALIFNQTDIITPEDRIIRGVSYAFLKPYINGKETMQVECEFYENKTDVFPAEVVEGEEPIQAKGTKGVIVLTVNANLSMEDVSTVIHKAVIEQLEVFILNNNIQIDAL